jgi:hypothetical protein
MKMDIDARIGDFPAKKQRANLPNVKPDEIKQRRLFPTLIITHVDVSPL